METSQDAITERYLQMESNGWSTSQALKWGFFFYSGTKEGLRQLYAELVDHDYQFDGIESRDDEWMLRVSKCEVLPADKLYRRCLAFNELAVAYDAFYDGWDVGSD